MNKNKRDCLIVAGFMLAGAFLGPLLQLVVPLSPTYIVITIVATVMIGAAAGLIVGVAIVLLLHK
jgi:hypothetical protein